jgi:LysR family carnitine catabolism transcriptional activator
LRIRLTLAQLEAFLRVAEHGSFRGAARSLNLSQPALSRTIRITEEILHAQLFDRQKQKVELTPSGLELVPIARRILGEFENSFTDLSRFIQGGAGRVAVATLPSIAIWLLPAVITSFRQSHPEVVFVLKDNTAAMLLEDLADGSADFAITAGSAISEKFEFRPLTTDEFVLVCRHDDPLASEASVPWTMFSTRPFVAVSQASSVRSMTDEAFRREGINVTPTFEVSSWTLAGHLVRAGLGIAAMPRLTVKLTDFSGLAFRPLVPEVRRRIGIVTVKGRTLPPVSQRFLNYLVRHAERFEATTP